MRSNRSLFNWAVLRKDITRFWPLWLVYGIFTINLTDILYIVDGGIFDAWSYELRWTGITNAFYALIVVLCLFGDLSNRRMSNVIHTLPVRRESWYATHMLSGILFWIVPNLFRTLIYTLSAGELWYLGLAWLGAMLLQYLFFLSLGALCAVCTGTKLGLTVTYLLTNFGSWLILAFVELFYQPLLKGVEISTGWALLLSPVSKMLMSEYFIIDEQRVGDRLSYTYTYSLEGFGQIWWYLAALGVLALVMMGLGILAYRKRQMEYTGEFVVFSWVKQVIWSLVTLTIGLIFQSLGLLSGTGTVFLIIGLVVGGLLAEMLVTKSVKTVLRGLLKGVILAAVIGISIIVVALDPIGLTRWVPEADQVESVTVCDSLNYDKEYSYYDAYTVQDPERIEQLLAVHRQLTKDCISEWGTIYEPDCDTLYISYKLKNGKEVVRKYYYPKDSQAAELMDQFWTRPEVLLGYTDWDLFLNETYKVQLNYAAGDVILYEQETRELLTAIKADCEAGTWDNSGMWTNDGYCCVVWGDYYDSVDVGIGSVNTVQWLREYYPEVFKGYSIYDAYY